MHNPHLRSRGKISLVLGCLLSVPIMAFIALTQGSVDISWSGMVNAWYTGPTDTQYQVIFLLRLPRVLSAIAVGGLLALAGTLMQVLLRNPLADPYVLGVSGGASVATLVGILLGLTLPWLNVTAFCGALVSMALLFWLAKDKGQWSPLRLLLTGVVLAAGWGACISFILATTNDQRLYTLQFWLMGDLSFSQAPVSALLVLVTGLLCTQPLARSLNVLTRGEHQAMALGVETQRLYFVLFVIASLLTATAVSLAGNIGFIGLVVPHILRLAGLYDHRFLLIGASALGASLLVAADTVARTLLAPQQLPVGVVTALLGIPLFLFLLRQRDDL